MRRCMWGNGAGVDGCRLIFEAWLAEPGEYPSASHAFADATKGAVEMLTALGSVPTGR